MRRKHFIILVLSFSAVGAALFFLFIADGTSNEKHPQNVIVFMVDCLRYDHTGFNGYSRDVTPFVDSLAQRGVVFDRFYSQTGWTLPSVASYLTGMYPEFHGVEKYRDRLNEDHVTMGEFFSAAGYRTVGLCANFIVNSEAAFDQGFDTWINSYHDDCLVRLAEAEIDPRIPGPRELREDNLFDYEEFTGSVLYKFPAGGKAPGYYTKKSYHLAVTGPDIYKEHEIISSSGSVSGGKYTFGIALRSDSADGELTLRLKSVDGRALFTRKITPSKKWKFYAYEVALKEAGDISLTASGVIKDATLFIDAPYLTDERPEQGNKFIYLHLMEAHEPNKIQPYLAEGYLGKFRGNSLPAGSVKYPPGDPFGFTLCKRLFPVWNEEDNRVNWHLNRYDETVRFLDDQARYLVEALKRNGEFEDTLIVFTSDHGQEFLEHGWIGHNYSLYDELLHVPMMIYYPKRLPGGKRVERNAQSIDLLPTLASVIGEKERYDSMFSGQASGRDLSGFFNGAGPSEEPLLVATETRNSLYAFTRGDWKLIVKTSRCAGGELLFNLDDDPGETRNLINEPEAKAALESLRASYRAYSTLRDKYLKTRPSLTVAGNEADLEKLVQLGYMNGPYLIHRETDVDCFLAMVNMLLIMLHYPGF